jgi:hypothetical protein
MRGHGTAIICDAAHHGTPWQWNALTKGHRGGGTARERVVMSPVRYPDSGWLSRADPAVRSVVIVATAAVIGTIVGGLSVLGVVVAVIQPPNYDSSAVARNDSGGVTAPAAPRQIQPAPQTAPAANSPAAAATAPAQGPAVALVMAPVAAQPVTPVQAQTMPPAQAQVTPPAQVLQNTWPDGLTERTRRARETKSEQPNQTPASAPVVQSSVAPNDDAKGASRSPPRPVHRTVTSRNAAAPMQLAPDNGAPRQRTVIIQHAPPQQTQTVEDAPASDEQRPLFDFFGQRHYNSDYSYHDNWNNDRHDW